MKVKIKNIRPHFQPNQVGIVKEFVKFLQNNGSLKSDVNILFQDKIKYIYNKQTTLFEL